MSFDFTAPTSLILITSFLGSFWLGVLSVLLFNLKRHYNNLTKKTNKSSLQEALDEIVKIQKDNQKQIGVLSNSIAALEKAGKLHLQYVGFKRFNPFGDTGGEQSFALSLLDSHKNGVVFSCLHSRDITRLYAKQVVSGKGKEFPLSKEEEAVVTHAQHAQI
ncbi:MAG: DUF4446 family protein [Patescibacteria group bacterium]|jgi:hypothetical protein